MFKKQIPVPNIPLGIERINVFIPMSFLISNEKKQSDDTVVQLRRIESGELEIPDLNYVAKVITNESKELDFKIGTTKQEAIAAANLHSYSFPKLIIEINVPRNKLSKTRQTESERFGENLLSANNNKKYHWLPRGSTVRAEDITSIYVMTMGEYYNTIRFDLMMLKGWSNQILYAKETKQCSLNTVR